jgi:hypothetical protein
MSSAEDRRWVAPGGLAALGVSSFARKTVDLGIGGATGAPEKAKNRTPEAFRRSKERW